MIGHELQEIKVTNKKGTATLEVMKTEGLGVRESRQTFTDKFIHKTLP